MTAMCRDWIIPAPTFSRAKSSRSGSLEARSITANFLAMVTAGQLDSILAARFKPRIMPGIAFRPRYRSHSRLMEISWSQKGATFMDG